jgi:hypothetical protein
VRINDYIPTLDEVLSIAAAVAFVGIGLAVNRIVSTSGIPNADSVSLVTGLLAGLAIGAVSLARARAQWVRRYEHLAGSMARGLRDIADQLDDGTTALHRQIESLKPDDVADDAVILSARVDEALARLNAAADRYQEGPLSMTAEDLIVFIDEARDVLMPDIDVLGDDSDPEPTLAATGLGVPAVIGASPPAAS